MDATGMDAKSWDGCKYSDGYKLVCLDGFRCAFSDMGQDSARRNLFVVKFGMLLGNADTSVLGGKTRKERRERGREEVTPTLWRAKHNAAHASE